MRTNRYVLMREIPYLSKKKSSSTSCKSKAKKYDFFYYTQKERFCWSI